MRGVVMPNLEATLPVKLFGAGGREAGFVAVIDTGYSGILSLPMAEITASTLSPLAGRTVRLADGTTRVIDTFEAELAWDGQNRTVRVLALDGDPLIGTALLKGFDLTVEFVDGGAVTVTARP